MDLLRQLNAEIIACEQCPRLRAWCQEVALQKRAAFKHEEYWGRPVPNFGAEAPTGLIIGLAPAAHGANRTGRMFTGDRSGEWLYRALHRANLASQAESNSLTDGLVLNRVLITAAVHCAPPGNKPTTAELQNCSRYLRFLVQSHPWKAFLCLGSVAWKSLFDALNMKPSTRFGHGAEVRLSTSFLAFASYHPSQQNTFTGRLTEAMLDDVVNRFAEACC